MGDQEEVYPCKICGRKFIPSSLDKHQPVCKKLSKLNRKPFDSGKQRAKGSDVNYSDVKKAQKEKELNGGIFPRPQTNWRERHETFINAVSQSKKVDYALKTGAPLPPPPKTAVPSDYVQCEYCGRNFNERAAERHIPFCRDQHNRNKPPKPPSTGMKPLAGHKPPTSHASSRQSRSPTRSSSRSRADTRASTREREDLKERRRSLDTRESVRSKQASPHRPSAQSASYTRNGVPPTPNRRSLSAPKTPGQSRLKQP
ncbi:unnamed protein product [Auanema sp. JU1783]|nr:unnamed protein product [Auanema sp. JU1783]